jgi:hypothetical protein
MPTERPGAGVYVVATKLHHHDEPATENGFVGIAVKQRYRSPTLGIAGSKDIPVTEPFHIRVKGSRQIDTTAGTKGAGCAGATIGQGVYIRPADDTLHLAGATAVGDLPFGRVTELPGVSNRGVPPNRIRIDLDQKDTLAAA